MLPFVLFAVFNVVLGNMEPLVGGPIENFAVMTGMGGFYAFFVIVPLVWMRKQTGTVRPAGIDALLGALAGALMLLCVELLPLNGWGVAQLGAAVVVTGVGCALLVHLVGRGGWAHHAAAQPSHRPSRSAEDG